MFFFSRNLSCSRSVHDRDGLIYARRLGSVLSFRLRQKRQNMASVAIIHSVSIRTGTLGTRCSAPPLRFLIFSIGRLHDTIRNSKPSTIGVMDYLR